MVTVKPTALSQVLYNLLMVRVLFCLTVCQNNKNSSEQNVFVTVKKTGLRKWGSQRIRQSPRNRYLSWILIKRLKGTNNINNYHANTTLPRQHDLLSFPISLTHPKETKDCLNHLLKRRIQLPCLILNFQHGYFQIKPSPHTWIRNCFSCPTPKLLPYVSSWFPQAFWELLEVWDRDEYHLPAISCRGTKKNGGQNGTLQDPIGNGLSSSLSVPASETYLSRLKPLQDGASQS